MEVLRWVRANGCPWRAEDRDKAAEKLGYTDDFGNMYLPTSAQQDPGLVQVVR